MRRKEFCAQGGAEFLPVSLQVRECVQLDREDRGDRTPFFLSAYAACCIADLGKLPKLIVLALSSIYVTEA